MAIEEESELYSFSYSYPGQVAAIPELKARFDREQAQSRKALIAQAREARADAKDMGFPYNAYALGTSWEVVADTPRFLSLSADIYTYSGGAHPNSTATSLVWDREARRALEPLDFFASPEALNDAVSEPYCKSLNDQRAERTGEPVDNSDPVFGGCPTVEQLTVVLGSTNGKTFDRIGLIAPPYVAGSYAEGEYAVTLPVTEPVMKALKPAYREAFARR
ncbi:DUF4163 domain-containing protein [Erythrobacter litoralis]|uniref:DUF4163 domain-containing protein n=1 Tax=Erythrobacter litoralis TaxID=39960 RepID=UPI003AF11367